MGRPSSFTEETAARICAQIAEGKSLRSICKADDMPDKATVFRWLGENTKFRDQYAQAHEEQAEFWRDEILAVAYDDAGDYGFKETEDESGQSAKPVILQDNIQRARLKVDSLKWIACKLFPRKYGDFQRTELTGQDGGPVQLTIAEQIRKSHGD